MSGERAAGDLHVAVVSPFPAADGRITGGVEAAAWYLVHELVALPGLAVTVLSTNSPTPDGATASVGGVAVHRLVRPPRPSRLPAPLRELGAGRAELARVLARLDPDLAHFEGLPFLALGCAAPSVVTVHGIPEREALVSGRRALRPVAYLAARLAWRLAFRRLPNVILSSPYVAELLPRPRAGQRRWVVDNAIGPSFFAVERRPEAGRVLVCGRVSERKNTLGMIRAFAAVHRQVPAVRLRLAGREEPGYGRRCRELAARLGVGASIDFLGNLDLPAIHAELARAACFVLPSLQETAPLSIGEAMAAGVPVIASQRCGNPHLVAHERSGLLVDPGNPAAIAAAVCRLLGERELAAAMGDAARAEALRRFRAEVIARDTVAIYRELLVAAGQSSTRGPAPATS